MATAGSLTRARGNARSIAAITDNSGCSRRRVLDAAVIRVHEVAKKEGREYDVVFVWHPLAGRRDATAFHLEAGRMCVMLSRHRHAAVVVGRAGADRLLSEFPDSDPVFLEEPEKFPDGWEANRQVLEQLHRFQVPLTPR